MSYHRVAFGKGVNQRGTTEYVWLYKHEAGTDENKEFHLGPDGYKLTYNYPNDQILQPGITSTELEVTTIWDDVTALETILSDIATGPEGKYFIGIHATETSSVPLHPFFVILPESMTVADEFDNVEVTFRGTDGLALLRNVDYNNDGTPYTDHQTILQHIKNVQSKQILFDVYEDLGDTYGNNARVFIRENIVSVDDELYSAYPPSVSSGTPKRTRVHHRTFHKQGQDGVNEYFSAYDVLESICLTFGFTVYAQNMYFTFSQGLTDVGQRGGRQYSWDGSEVVIADLDTFYHFNGVFDIGGGYSTDNVKGANWTRSFAPPAGDVRLVRNTQGDQGVIYATNLAPNTQLFDANDTYDSGDQLKIRGSIRIQNENSYTFTGGDRLKRLIPTFVITLTDDNGDTIYFNNVLATLNELAAHQLNTNAEGSANVFTNNVNYTPASVNVAAWSSNVGTYSYLNRSNTEQGYLHDANENFDFVVQFEFSLGRGLPTSNGPFTDLTLTPRLLSYDSANNVDNTYSDSLTVRFVEVGAYRMANGEVQAVSKFTHRAHTDTGRTEINLGETLIGDRGAKTYFGGIEVYDGTDWVASSGWVTQEQSTPRTINQIVVEEVCAFHKRVKQVQAGSIVQNRLWQGHVPWIAFKDVATNFVYAPLAFTRNFTSAIDEVSLVLVGRNLLDITATQEGKDTSAVTTYAKPNNNDAIANVWNVGSNLGGISQTYHNEARLLFGNNWSSVIGADETKEYYVTYNIDGQGIRVDHQGESPTAGTNIQRRIYFNQQALASPSTSPPWAALHSTYQPPEGFTLQGTIDRSLAAHYATVGTNGRASYLITYSEVSTSFLLDDFSEYQAAYSLRKLRTGYTGDAIRVQRASDSALQDIGFDSSGELDTTALSNFAAGGTLTVRTWYDQGGFGYDCIQSSVSAQPTIVASGQIVTVNGKPAVDFDGTSDFLTAGTVNLNPSPRTVLTFAGVYQFDSVSSGQYVAAQWSSTTSNQVLALLNLATASMRFMARFQNGSLSRVNSGSGTTAINTQYVGVGQFKQNHSKGVLNGTDYSDTNVNSTVNHASSQFTLGHRPDTGTGKFNGKLQEFVVWSQITASQAHDRDAISQAIDDHYGVY